MADCSRRLKSRAPLPFDCGKLEGKERKYVECKKVEWDTDVEEVDSDLPEVVIAPFAREDMQDYWEAATDLLSYLYGFCIKNCSIRICD